MLLLFSRIVQVGNLHSSSNGHFYSSHLWRTCQDRRSINNEANTTSQEDKRCLLIMDKLTRNKTVPHMTFTKSYKEQESIMNDTNLDLD